MKLSGVTERVPVLLVGICLVSLACEKAVFVELPPHEPQLVVTGFFSPDSLWAVDVSSSVSYSSLAEPEYINSASVEIRAGDDVVERLSPVGNGRYESLSRRPTAGQRYTLRVSAPDYSSVEARGELPEFGGSSRVRTGQPERTVYGSVVVPLELDFEDAEATRDYYGLFSLLSLVHRVPETGATYRETHKFGFTSRDLALREDNVFDTDETWHEEAFFGDDVFNGRSYTLEFKVELFGVNPLPPTIIGLSLDVFFLSVSEDYYLHEKSAQLQDDVEDNPFSEPVQIHSNVSNGYGVFAGYRARRHEVDLDLGG